MKVLIACEESQRVCISFREKGHEAYSCDIQKCSGGHPEWHIQDNVLNVINDPWDIIIAHPPCTYLTVAGNRWFDVSKYGDKALMRMDQRRAAIDFFMQIVNSQCDKICIENPVGIMSTIYRKPDQIIQPYYFGDHARKKTCLWLKNLPPLIPTDIVDAGKIIKGGYSVGASAHYARDTNGKIIRWNDPETAKIRSKTFWGIAMAMAKQWG